MKKLNVFFLLIVTIFASCSKDDDSGTIDITEANLIGKWQYIAATSNGKPETLNECELTNTVEYKTSGIVEHVYHEPTTIGCSKNSYDSRWSLTGKTISYEAGDDPEEILELTSSSLKIVHTETEGTETIIFVDAYKKI